MLRCNAKYFGDRKVGSENKWNTLYVTLSVCPYYIVANSSSNVAID